MSASASLTRCLVIAEINGELRQVIMAPRNEQEIAGYVVRFCGDPVQFGNPVKIVAAE